MVAVQTKAMDDSNVDCDRSRSRVNMYAGTEQLQSYKLTKRGLTVLSDIKRPHGGIVRVKYVAGPISKAWP